MARMIPDSEIDALKRSIDLLALVRSRGIELQAHGSKDWIGRCPFHSDNLTPNFIVTPVKNLWHCMACGAAGNAIQFIERHDKVSFRHAFELLKHGSSAAFEVHRQLSSRASIRRLACPLDEKADDAALLSQVADYYHERLKEMPQAKAYLASRNLNHEEMINHFKIGFADRTLGLRLPESNRAEGQLLRSRLTQLGIWRQTGREHFNGCVVVPLCDADNKIVSFYGRRIATQDGFKHFYPAGEHRGLFNPQAFDSSELILCEAVIDALTFWMAGFKNVSCIFGTEGFSDELWQLILKKKIARVRLAYDADEAGERAAQRDAERLKTQGIEVYQIKFPYGMDANDYGRKVTPAAKSLALLLNASAWMGNGHGKAPSNVVREVAPAPSSLIAAVLAAEVSSPKESAKKESLSLAVPPLASTAKPGGESGIRNQEFNLTQRGEAWFLDLENRNYRISGLEKTLNADHLKVGLRVQVGEKFHLDQVDLMRDLDRRRFIERASEETTLATEILKRDLGRILLAVEQEQVKLLTSSEKLPLTITLSPEEREEALKWLQEPGLVDRLKDSFKAAGIIGESDNALVAYLACVSRKLERPLAVIIQSASAAGKTTLMDAVLSFFPEEERIKYSAMTGQSLYYLGQTSLQHKILAVVEETGAEKASYALKLLQSEGELAIASTGKDPQTGRMITQEYRVEGPVTIMLTTTAIDLDEELQNRCLTLAVDETQEQTEAIHRLQRERRTLSGLIASEERKDLLKKLRNAQRLLAPLKILNPYALELTFPSDRTRNRRDHEKYLTLIDTIALLHQHQRRCGQHIVNNRIVEFIEVSLEDIALANQLAPEVLGRSLDELPPQTRACFNHIRELAKDRAKPFLFSRRELKESCGWSLTQVRIHLSRLLEHEYLTLRHGRLGSSFLYELLIDTDASENTAHIRLIDVEELRKKYAYNEQGDGKIQEVAGGGKSDPATLKAFNSKPIVEGWRPDASAHLEGRLQAVAL